MFCMPCCLCSIHLFIEDTDVIPNLPEWEYDRPYLSYDFPRVNRQFVPPVWHFLHSVFVLISNKKTPIGALPIEAQEISIIEDVLFLMMVCAKNQKFHLSHLQGVEGRFIKIDISSVLRTPKASSTAASQPTARVFSIDQTLGRQLTSGDVFLMFIDKSLKELLVRILPICSHYSTVARFVEGRVPVSVN